MGQASIGDLRVTQIECFQGGHIGQFCHPGIRDSCTSELQCCQFRQIFDVVERVIRYAFELPVKRNKGGSPQVTLVDKANAIRAQDIWTRTFKEVASEYPGVKTDHAYIDAACMWMVKNPEWFDVAVSPNLFGDIITDLGAMIQGGMGVAASGNLHPGKVSMFEPIHGSAPKYKGQNKANPIATIAAVSMLLNHLGQTESSQKIDAAVEHLIVSKEIPDLSSRSGLKTSEIGDMVCNALKR